MTEAIKTVTLINIIFILGLGISSSFGGVVGELLYYSLVFTLPVLIGLSSSVTLKKKREEIAGVAEEPDRFLNFDLKVGRMTLPLIAPSVAVVFLLSLLTSLLLSSLGASSPAVADKDIVTMLIVHALTPAVLEEALFRYVPMKLLAPYSKRTCIIYSAFCFALIHCSFWQMPYAFVAGMIFMSVDLALGSVWPSVILHLVNNAASVVMMKYCTTPTATLTFVLVMLSLVLLSLVFIFLGRRKYRDAFVSAFEGGEKSETTYAPIILAIMCGSLALMNLIS
jgi:membrane protease YdiL (CAAX protease family)